MNEEPREFKDAAKAMIPIIEALKEDEWNSRAEMAARVQEHIQHLEAQLAARNQAAEAMGVLGRLVDGDQFIRFSKIGDRNDARGHFICAVVRGSKPGDETCSEAHSLIEAVLKAGGEGQ